MYFGIVSMGVNEAGNSAEEDHEPAKETGTIVSEQVHIGKATTRGLLCCCTYTMPYTVSNLVSDTVGYVCYLGACLKLSKVKRRDSE